LVNMEFVLREIDRLFDENRAAEVEPFLLELLEEAREEGDHGVCLQILNELIGYYRQTSEREKLTTVIEEALAIANDMGLRETIWYGTTALNAANGYRSMGALALSRKYYQEAEAIYDRELGENNALKAGLYNNRSLLEQEEGRFQQAEEYLLKALKIVEANHSGFEIAVTYANLANTAVLAKDFERAKAYAKHAILCFQRRHLYDAHYCAALSALATCYFYEEDYEEALRIFEEAMNIVETTIGRNSQYERLVVNRDACIQKLKELHGAWPREEDGKGNDYARDNGNESDSAEKQHNEKQSDISVTSAAKKEHAAGNNTWQELGSMLQEELGKQEAKDKNASGQAVKEADKFISGLELCKRYYEAYGKEMLVKEFPEYVSRIAVGLVGEGSDCMGFDDEASRDHDWGPGFCVWIPEELEPVIGEKLRECYDALPEEFMGLRRVKTAQGKSRLGVMTIEGFYRKYAGMQEDGSFDWRGVEDASLLAASDGEVFADPEGRFSEIRAKLQAGYPEEIRFLKIAEDCAKISQTGQYNYFRMLERRDRMTADGMLTESMRHVMRLWHHLSNSFPPHDKWLKKSTERLPGGGEVVALLEQLHASLQMDDERAYAIVKEFMEELCSGIARSLYDESLISDVDSYLDHQVEELLMKAGYAKLSNEELVRRIAKTEFEAFDKVKNEGGRAYCQNDWPTFSVMRKSQYLTWDRTMLLQYLYDFERETALGHNLITEKYGRMMESTAPEKYEDLEKHFPELSEEKKAVIEQIVALQMSMVEEFAKEYPKVVSNARNLHTYEDDMFDTSYETYLRGEISTYSDKMLQLYAGYVIRCAREGVNIARATIENTARLYGYQNLEDFQASITE